MGSSLRAAGLPAGGVLEQLYQKLPQNDRDDEQGQRNRGTATELEVLERDVEQVDRQDVGGIVRPAAGQDQDRVDEAEIVHEPQHDRDQQERVEIGQRDRH